MALEVLLELLFQEQVVVQQLAECGIRPSVLRLALQSVE